MLHHIITKMHILLYIISTRHSTQHKKNAPSPLLFEPIIMEPQRILNSYSRLYMFGLSRFPLYFAFYAQTHSIYTPNCNIISLMVWFDKLEQRNQEKYYVTTIPLCFGCAVLLKEAGEGDASFP